MLYQVHPFLQRIEHQNHDPILEYNWLSNRWLSTISDLAVSRESVLLLASQDFDDQLWNYPLSALKVVFKLILKFISVRQIFENRPEIRSISSALNIVDIPSVIFFNSRLVSSELNKPTIIFIQISRTSLLTIWLKRTAQKSTQKSPTQKIKSKPNKLGYVFFMWTLFQFFGIWNRETTSMTPPNDFTQC